MDRHPQQQSSKFEMERSLKLLEMFEEKLEENPNSNSSTVKTLRRMAQVGYDIQEDIMSKEAHANALQHLAGELYENDATFDSVQAVAILSMGKAFLHLSDIYVEHKFGNRPLVEKNSSAEGKTVKEEKTKATNEDTVYASLPISPGKVKVEVETEAVEQENRPAPLTLLDDVKEEADDVDVVQTDPKEQEAPPSSPDHRQYHCLYCAEPFSLSEELDDHMTNGCSVFIAFEDYRARNGNISLVAYFELSDELRKASERPKRKLKSYNCGQCKKSIEGYLPWMTHEENCAASVRSAKSAKVPATCTATAIPVKRGRGRPRKQRIDESPLPPNPIETFPVQEIKTEIPSPLKDSPIAQQTRNSVQGPKTFVKELGWANFNAAISDEEEEDTKQKKMKKSKRGRKRKMQDGGKKGPVKKAKMDSGKEKEVDKVIMKTAGDKENKENSVNPTDPVMSMGKDTETMDDISEETPVNPSDPVVPMEAGEDSETMHVVSEETPVEEEPVKSGNATEVDVIILEPPVDDAETRDEEPLDLAVYAHIVGDMVEYTPKENIGKDEEERRNKKMEDKTDEEPPKRKKKVVQPIVEEDPEEWVPEMQQSEYQEKMFRGLHLKEVLKCPFCEAQHENIKDLDEHFSKMHGQSTHIPYQCEGCRQLFIKPRLMEQHFYNQACRHAQLRIVSPINPHVLLLPQLSQAPLFVPKMNNNTQSIPRHPQNPQANKYLNPLSKPLSVSQIAQYPQFATLFQ